MRGGRGHSLEGLPKQRKKIRLTIGRVQSAIDRQDRTIYEPGVIAE
jgi:hypothetical protein